MGKDRGGKGKGQGREGREGKGREGRERRRGEGRIGPPSHKSPATSLYAAGIVKEVVILHRFS
jgi:hypothetical protein